MPSIPFRRLLTTAAPCEAWHNRSCRKQFPRSHHECCHDCSHNKYMIPGHTMNNVPYPKVFVGTHAMRRQVVNFECRKQNGSSQCIGAGARCCSPRAELNIEVLHFAHLWILVSVSISMLDLWTHSSTSTASMDRLHLRAEGVHWLL